MTERDILYYYGRSIETKATATGNAIMTEGDPELVSGDAETTVDMADPDHNLHVRKTASAPANGVTYVKGEEITYTITVTNSGNVTLSGITATDSKTGLSETIDSLAPRESKEYTTKHTITAEDIWAGSFVNTAIAAGIDPGGA